MIHLNWMLIVVAAALIVVGVLPLEKVVFTVPKRWDAAPAARSRVRLSILPQANVVKSGILTFQSWSTSIQIAIMSLLRMLRAVTANLVRRKPPVAAGPDEVEGLPLDPDDSSEANTSDGATEGSLVPSRCAELDGDTRLTFAQAVTLPEQRWEEQPRRLTFRLDPADFDSTRESVYLPQGNDTGVPTAAASAKTLDQRTLEGFGEADTSPIQFAVGAVPSGDHLERHATGSTKDENHNAEPTAGTTGAEEDEQQQGDSAVSYGLYAETNGDQADFFGANALDEEERARLLAELDEEQERRQIAAAVDDPTNRDASRAAPPMVFDEDRNGRESSISANAAERLSPDVVPRMSDTAAAVVTHFKWTQFLGPDQPSLGESERRNLIWMLKHSGDDDFAFTILAEAFLEEKPDGLRPLIVDALSTLDVPDLRRLYDYLLKYGSDEEKRIATSALVRPAC